MHYWLPFCFFLLRHCYEATAQEPSAGKYNLMHERKEFTLKKKLTTTSLLGPRISCHFFISSSSSKAVSFIPWKTEYKSMNIQNNIKGNIVINHSQPAEQHTFVTTCKVFILALRSDPQLRLLKCWKLLWSYCVSISSPCVPDNNKPYLSDVCPVSLLVYLRKNSQPPTMFVFC